MITDAKIPFKLEPVFDNLSSNQYDTIALYGGRGGAKSEALALAGVMESYIDDGVILCAREILKSIKQSLHASVKAKIFEMGLEADFYITDNEIRNTRTGSLFMFAGLKSNIESIKSIKNLRVVLVDEAENVSQNSWDNIRPTPRYGHTRLYVIFNPRFEKDATWQEFIATPDENTLVIKINYDDNPWFPISLDRQRKRALKGDIGKYNWIWLGRFLKVSDRSIFGKQLSAHYFEIDESFGDPLIGVDWGFSVDPTAGIELYTRGNDLYVRNACSKVKLELKNTASYLVKNIPPIGHYTSRADCARPETISHVRDDIPLIKACAKWAGCVEDGIIHIQSYDNIYIHPDCPDSVFAELSEYQYKVDKDDNITAIPEDKNNHYADAMRYALEPRIARKGGFMFG